MENMTVVSTTTTSEVTKDGCKYTVNKTTGTDGKLKEVRINVVNAEKETYVGSMSYTGQSININVQKSDDANAIVTEIMSILSDLTAVAE